MKSQQFQCIDYTSFLHVFFLGHDKAHSPLAERRELCIYTHTHCKLDIWTIFLIEVLQDFLYSLYFSYLRQINKVDSDLGYLLLATSGAY